MRLLRLHDFNRILYSKKTWKRIEECLIEKTSAQNVKDISRGVLRETFMEIGRREAEFTLIEINGSEIYTDPAFLSRHVEETLLRWRIKLMMRAITLSCGGEYTGNEADLLFSAALDAGKLTPEELR
jgi:hypothetical protein